MSRRTNPKTPTPRDLTIFERAVVRGERQTDLAREFGLTKQRINTICGRVGRLVFEKTAEDFSEHRRKTLLRLEHLYSEATTAWEKSKTGRCSETETTNGSGLPVRSTTRQTTSGDVRYLTEARQVLNDIRQLCGLDPTKSEVLEVRTTKALQVKVNYDALSLDELERMSQLAILRRQGLIRVVEIDGVVQVEDMRDGGGGASTVVDPPPSQDDAIRSEGRYNLPETFGRGGSHAASCSSTAGFKFQTNWPVIPETSAIDLQR